MTDEATPSYPHWLFHPELAPEGRLFATAADDPEDMTGWVESPADFPGAPKADMGHPSSPIVGSGIGGAHPSNPIASDRPPHASNQPVRPEPSPTEKKRRE